MVAAKPKATRGWSKRSFTPLEEYLCTGVSAFNKGGMAFVSAIESQYYVEGRFLFIICDYGGLYRPEDDEFPTWLKGFSKHKRPPIGVIIPSLGKSKFVLLADSNMDEEIYPPSMQDRAVKSINGTDLLITTSFICLARLFAPPRKNPTQKDIAKVVANLANGKIKMLDCVPDSSLGLTAKEKKLISFSPKNPTATKPFVMARRELTARPGYTLLAESNGICWHRAATILIQREAAGKKRTYILGQDEDTFFGCELSKHTNTLKDAFLMLMPPEAQGVKKVRRQGEWFFIPLASKEVPDEKDCICTVNSGQLPTDDPKSNIHTVETFAAPDRQFRALVHAKMGLILPPKTYIDHPEHGGLELGAGYYLVRKNTAIRSVSQTGVD